MLDSLLIIISLHTIRWGRDVVYESDGNYGTGERVTICDPALEQPTNEPTSAPTRQPTPVGGCPNGIQVLLKVDEYLHRGLFNANQYIWTKNNLHAAGIEKR